MDHVPRRLDHQGPQAERAHRVLDDPPRRLRETSPGKRTNADEQLTCKASGDRFHSAHLPASTPPRSPLDRPADTVRPAAHILIKVLL
ncbi:hypothetical protein GCM10009736_11560 [Actinomadura bangladeshensis]